LFAGGPSHVGEKAVIRSISVLTGAVQAVADSGFEAEASPDGKQLLYVDGASREIKIAGAQGDSPRTFFRAAAGEFVESVHWLPEGKRVGYVRGRDGAANTFLETRDATGNNAKTVLEANTESIAFAPGGRVFYTTKDTSPQQHAELWTAAIDPVTGERVGEPARLSVWPDAVAAEPLTISADGSRLGVTKQFVQSDVYLLGLDAAGTAIKSSRALTTDTRVDWPSQWSHDGSSFLFFSNRTGALRAFRQPVAAEVPEPIVTGAGHARSPHLTPDGEWIVYVDMTDQPQAARVMRVPASGGPAERVMAIGTRLLTASMQYLTAVPGTSGVGARSYPDLRCPARWDGSCVLAEARDDDTLGRSRIVLSAFNPASGVRRDLATISSQAAGLTFWDVSPDGSTLAYGEFSWEGGDRITILRLDTGAKRDLQLGNVKNLSDVAWAADGRSLFATASTIRGGELLRVTLEGHVEMLRIFDSHVVLNPRPSPDGKSLLVGVTQVDSNAWVIER
jgi:Tol biopolymer transport system component